MQLLHVFLIVLEFLLFLYLLFVTLYNVILAFAGLLRPKHKRARLGGENKIAVLIPAYREDAVIFDSVLSLVAQEYPPEKFSIIVIADSLKDETLEKLKQLPVQCIKVAFDLSTKVKALNAALATTSETYDIGVVLDADNFAEKHFLSLVNEQFNAGYRSVQGQRKPKNKETRMALLDGLSEAINNHLVRKGTCRLGGSSAIVGSGFGVDYTLLKETLSSMDSVGGFDKELEIRLLLKGIKTQYIEQAIVYDEKVRDREVFKQQRKRWIASQFFYLKKYFFESWSGLLRGDIALFNSAFLRYVQLPRFLNLGLLFFATLSVYVLRDHLWIPYPYYLSLCVLFVGSILLSIPRPFYTWELIKAAMALPVTFFTMFLLLFQLKGANKKYIHTPHQAQNRGE